MPFVPTHHWASLAPLSLSWEPLAALRPQSHSGALFPLLPLPLAHPHLLTSLAPGASRRVGSLWKPSVALGPQSDSGSLCPSTPLPLSLPGLWDLSKPWEHSEAFGSQQASVRLRGLVPFAPHHHLAPEPPWLLGPQEALGDFGSLGASVRLGALVPLAPPLPCSLRLPGPL